MLIVLASIMGSMAALAWIFAVVSCLQLVGMTPAGQKLATTFDLGWWKFSAIEGRIGPAARPVIKNYVRAFLVFFLCVILLAVLSIFGAMSEQTGTRPAQTAAGPEGDRPLAAVQTAAADLILPNSSALES
jgi:hypothetical protein